MFFTFYYQDIAVAVEIKGGLKISVLRPKIPYNLLMKVGRIHVRERSTGPTRVANSFECDNRLLNAIKKPFKTFKTTKVFLRQPSR